MMGETILLFRRGTPMTRSGVGLLLAVCALAAGCGNGDQQDLARQRAKAFVRHLTHNEIDACVQFAAPALAKQEGTGALKARFATMHAALKLEQQAEVDVRIDQVKLSGNHKTAEVRYSVQSGGEWVAQPPLRWVLVDGQWFITF
jgi:hypothetical protein